MFTILLIIIISYMLLLRRDFLKVYAIPCKKDKSLSYCKPGSQFLSIFINFLNPCSISSEKIISIKLFSIKNSLVIIISYQDISEQDILVKIISAQTISIDIISVDIISTEKKASYDGFLNCSICLL